MSTIDEYEPVECTRHGVLPPAFICQHLADGSGSGFFTSIESPGNPWPDAWCAACEEISNAVGGWDEESEKAAGITLVCSACYEEIRTRQFRLQVGT